jgi:hypothetical protein
VDQRPDEAGYPGFVRFDAKRGSVPGDRLVSRGALRLHVYAVLASIEAGRSGLISDEYLDGVSAETSVTALELCTAGLWTRVEDGYRVDESETLRMASEVHRQLEELSQQCRATTGHQPDPDHPGLCRNCGVQLGT